MRVVETDRDEAWGSSTWRALSEEREVGSATAWVRPDGRCFVSFAKCESGSQLPLVTAMEGAGQSRLYVSAADSDESAISLFEELGFVFLSREQQFVIPAQGAVAALASAELPDGVTSISPDEADLERLRTLDDALRHDVPGSSGWQWPVQAFRDETFGPQYDSALYAIAVEGGEYVGLARVWNRLPRPRLGMIGVRHADRRRGIAAGLLAQVFGVLAERGVETITSEVDVTNVASNALMLRLGARAVSSSVELVRESAAR